MDRYSLYDTHYLVYKTSNIMMNSKLEKIWNEAVVALKRYHPGI
jgi:hypothetical protein